MNFHQNQLKNLSRFDFTEVYVYKSCHSLPLPTLFYSIKAGKVFIRFVTLKTLINLHKWDSFSWQTWNVLFLRLTTAGLLSAWESFVRPEGGRREEDWNNVSNWQKKSFGKMTFGLFQLQRETSLWISDIQILIDFIPERKCLDVTSSSYQESYHSTLLYGWLDNKEGIK